MFLAALYTALVASSRMLSLTLMENAVFVVVTFPFEVRTIVKETLRHVLHCWVKAFGLRNLLSGPFVGLSLLFERG